MNSLTFRSLPRPWSLYLMQTDYAGEQLPVASFDIQQLPVFYVGFDLDEHGFNPSTITGILSSTLWMEDRTEVLLVDDFVNPMLSVVATIHYIGQDTDGYTYQYSFQQHHIGAARPYV